MKFQVKPDEEDFAAGVCRIEWSLFEKNDKATVQLIYAGTQDVPLVLTGIAKKQRAPYLVAYKPKKDNSFAGDVRVGIYLMIVAAVVACVHAILFFTVKPVFADVSDTQQSHINTGIFLLSLFIGGFFTTYFQSRIWRVLRRITFWL